jgi:hypothetical protein
MNRSKGILRRLGYICGVSAANTPNSVTINNPGNMNWLEGILAQKTVNATSDDRTYFTLQINSEQVIQNDSVQNYYSQNIQNMEGYIPVGRILSGNDNISVSIVSAVASNYNFTFIYAQKPADFIEMARRGLV